MAPDFGKRYFYSASEPQTGRELRPVLTTDNGRFTVGRARPAPAMISTPGHRASRRRQREALAWSKVIGEQLQAARSNQPTTLPRFGLMPRRAKAAALEHQLPFPQTMMVSRFDELTGPGTDGSNPPPCSGESQRTRFSQSRVRGQPSNLSSCSHSDPSGGWSTSLVSCGLVQGGSAVASARRRLASGRATSSGMTRPQPQWPPMAG